MSIKHLAIKSTAAGIIISTVLTVNGSAGNFEVDKDHSKVGFAVKHMVISTVTGFYTDFQVDLNFNESKVEESSVTAVIQTASITTANEKRDAHLKSKDFFSVEEFPVIKFVSVKVNKASNGYIAVGDLTIRNVTKRVEMPFNIVGVVKDPWGNTRAGFEAHLTINRQDFGVSWSIAMDKGGLVVDDKVDITIVIEAVKKQ